MGTQDEGTGEGSAPPASDSKKDDIYDARATSKKIIRVVTVIAYMISVSFVAIVLSAYYVFLWQPPNPRLMHRAHLRADPQIEYLVDKPPAEVAPNVTLTPDEIRDKVNLFREEILRSRGVNVSFRRPSLDDKGADVNSASGRDDRVTLRNDTTRDNSPIPGASWSPIVRALLAATEPTTTQIARGKSTDVYKSFDSTTSTVTDSPETSTLFTRAREINQLFIVNVSLSSSSASLPEASGKLYNVSARNFASTTAATRFVAEATNGTPDDRGSGGMSQKSRSASTESSIEGIARTRSYDLVGSLGSSAGDLDRVGSSGGDQRVAGNSAINTSGVGEKNAAADDVPTVGSSAIDVLQGLPDKANAASDRRRDGRLIVLESISNPDTLGSHIARVSIKSTTNNTESLEKLGTSFPPENPAPIEIVPDPAGDEEEVVTKSPASIVPAVIQPDPEFIGKKQESNEEITQDGDFGFV